MMGFLTHPYWCKVRGHLWHGEDMEAYATSPPLTPSEGATGLPYMTFGYYLHMRCLRCGAYEKRKMPSPMTVSGEGVSLDSPE